MLVFVHGYQAEIQPGIDAFPKTVCAVMNFCKLMFTIVKISFFFFFLDEFFFSQEREK